MDNESYLACIKIKDETETKNNLEIINLSKDNSKLKKT